VSLDISIIDVKIQVKIDLKDLESEIKNVIVDALGVEVGISQPEKDKKPD